MVQPKAMVQPNKDPETRSPMVRLLAGAVLLAAAAVVVTALVQANSSDQGAAVSTEPAQTQPAQPAAAKDEPAEAEPADVDEANPAEAVADDVAADVADEPAAEEPAVETAAADPSATESEPDAPTESEPSGPKLDEAPPVLGQTAELTNIDGWLQSDIDALSDLDGKVHVVQFWTFGCYNCKNTLPSLIHLDETYGGDNFEIVGVHAPEFDYEKNPEAIQAAADELGVTWPIALDTNKTNFRSWQEDRRFWPRTYVIDQAGNIRFDRIGEGAYEKLEATVAWLLDEGPDADAT